MTADPLRSDASERAAGSEMPGGPVDMRTSMSGITEPRSAPQGLPAQAEMARQVAIQISEAVRSGEKPIELTLNPAELGRVRLSLAPGDGVMMVTVLADRPETLELMRRHIDMLAQELRAIGYGSTAFSFARGGGGAATGGFDTGGGADLDAAPETSETMASGAPEGVTERLDIRL